MVEFLAPKREEGNFLVALRHFTEVVSLSKPLEGGFIRTPDPLPGQHTQDLPHNLWCAEFQDGNSRALNQVGRPL